MVILSGCRRDRAQSPGAPMGEAWRRGGRPNARSGVRVERVLESPLDVTGLRIPSEDALIFKPTNRELLASLLVMVILVCHGAYGVNHQYVCETLVPQHSGEAASPESQTSGSGVEQPAAAAGHLSLLMTFFSLLAAALYTRLRGVPVPYATPSKFTFRERLPDIGLHPPRLSSPPVLQVFRL